MSIDMDTLTDWTLSMNCFTLCIKFFYFNMDYEHGKIQLRH